MRCAHLQIGRVQSPCRALDLGCSLACGNGQHLRACGPPEKPREGRAWSEGQASALVVRSCLRGPGFVPVMVRLGEVEKVGTKLPWPTARAARAPQVLSLQSRLGDGA